MDPNQLRAENASKGGVLDDQAFVELCSTVARAVCDRNLAKGATPLEATKEGLRVLPWRTPGGKRLIRQTNVVERSMAAMRPILDREFTRLNREHKALGRELAYVTRRMLEARHGCRRESRGRPVHSRGSRRTAAPTRAGPSDDDPSPPGVSTPPARGKTAGKVATIAAGQLVLVGANGYGLPLRPEALADLNQFEVRHALRCLELDDEQIAAAEAAVELARRGRYPGAARTRGGRR